MSSPIAEVDSVSVNARRQEDSWQRQAVAQRSVQTPAGTNTPAGTAPPTQTPQLPAEPTLEEQLEAERAELARLQAQLGSFRGDYARKIEESNFSTMLTMTLEIAEDAKRDSSPPVDEFDQEGPKDSMSMADVSRLKTIQLIKEALGMNPQKTMEVLGGKITEVETEIARLEAEIAAQT